MKLSCLSEAASAKKQEFLAKKFQVDPSMVQQASDTDPTKKGRYTEWIISRVKAGDIDLNRDAPKISSALKDFEAISNKKLARQQYNLKDINQYNLDDVVKISNTFKGEAGPKPESISSPGLPGVKKFYDDGVIAILEVTDPDSAIKLASGTQWCTSKRDHADNYLSDGPLYVIYKNGKKIAQANSDQLMDLHDQEVLDLGLIKTLSNAGLDMNNAWYYAIMSSGEKNIEREPELERYIINDSWQAARYADRVIKGRWPEAEPTIIKNPHAATEYAANVLESRWPEAEPIILKSHPAMVEYAKNVIGGRWPEAESRIMKNPEAIVKYAADVLKSRWPEAESTILKDSWAAMRYAADVLKGRWPEAEPTIIKNPTRAYQYAEHVIKGRWPEAEPLILKDQGNAVWYAAGVIKGRWPEAEPIIMQSSSTARIYALNSIKGRWPEAEPIIMKDPDDAMWYAHDVIKGRWPEAEPYMRSDEGVWDMYVSEVLNANDQAIEENLDRIFGL